MHINKRVSSLSIATALVVSVVRHGVTTKWSRWDGWESFLGAWLIHLIALYFLGFGAIYAMSHWHKFFVGEERDLRIHGGDFFYYAVMTILMSALAIGFFSFAGPFGSDD